MALDREKLLKFLRLTESTLDGEALNALRMAQRLMKAEKVSWEDLLKHPAGPTLGMPVSPDYRTPPSQRRGTAAYGRPMSQTPREDPTRHTGDDIETMLEYLGQQRHDMSTMMMLASIREFWERNSYLTTPQYETIKRMADANRSAGRRGSGDRWRF